MSQLDITPRHTNLAIEGMHCASCVARVEKQLTQLDGVTHASVNLATQRAAITYLPARLDETALIDAVSASGYQAHSLSGAANQQTDQRPHEAQQQLKQDTLIAALFATPLMLIAMLPMWSPAANAMAALLPLSTWKWIELVLVLPVQFYAGRRFYRAGWRELRHLSPGMDSLVLLGANAAFFYSLAALLLPSHFPANTAHTYFDAAGMIITLILFGRYLETLAKGRASSAIRQLIELQPDTALVKRSGKWVELPLEHIVVGDLLAVRPGERIPVDGQVTAGTSTVNEAMISGESTPVEKQAGAKVIAGTINGNGRLEISADKIGSDTLLAAITRMVENAQAQKPAIQATADKIAGIFVPMVIGISIATFLLWLVFATEGALTFAFVTSVAVLLIACPCAMGLAAPVAIMVATGQAARQGMLFRQGSALEQLAQVDTVVFDKTGTLTEGHPTLTDFIVADGYHEADMLALLASVEAASEHALAKAIVEAAQQRKLAFQPVQQAHATIGQGIEAQIEARHILIGSDALMQQRFINTHAVQKTAQDFNQAGKTCVYMAINGTFVALAAITDKPRADAASTIQALHQKGIATLLLSGDNTTVATTVATALGIQRAIGNVPPDGKADIVEQLQQQNRHVAFVGDGINDAPALAQANVGIAIGSGTDIAMETADVVLMQSNLTPVIEALALSKRSLATIRGNFAWAYGYNLLLIPVAAGVLYPWTGWLLNPMIAAAAMSLSSLFVLANSLRLKRSPVAPA